MQTTAIRTVAKSLPQNEVILLTLLISKRYIPYTDLRKKEKSENKEDYIFQRNFRAGKGNKKSHFPYKK